MIKNNKIKIKGKITKFGRKIGSEDITILLTEVINLETNEVIRDHCWVTLKRTFTEMLKDKINNTIEFTGRLDSYFGRSLEQKTNIRHIRNILIKN